MITVAGGVSAVRQEKSAAFSRPGASAVPENTDNLVFHFLSLETEIAASASASSFKEPRASLAQAKPKRSQSLTDRALG